VKRKGRDQAWLHSAFCKGISSPKSISYFSDSDNATVWLDTFEEEFLDWLSSAKPEYDFSHPRASSETSKKRKLELEDDHVPGSTTGSDRSPHSSAPSQVQS
jgi:hypothetical protein